MVKAATQARLASPVSFSSLLELGKDLGTRVKLLPRPVKNEGQRPLGLVAALSSLWLWGQAVAPSHPTVFVDLGADNMFLPVGAQGLVQTICEAGPHPQVAQCPEFSTEGLT